MFLIRMAILGAIGYWVWKQFMAGQAEQGSGGQRGLSSSPQPQEQRDSEASSSGQLSGAGQGMRVATTDHGGGSTQHIVGRGVLR